MAAKRIAVLGGTGALGSKLAEKLASVGHKVTIGSRDPERASAVGAAFGAEGASYADAAAAAEIIILTVPFASHEGVLGEIRAPAQGKIVVDATVPLKPPKVSVVQLPPAGSAALTTQQYLGPEVSVVSAFQNVGARHFEAGHSVDCDVLVTGDSKDARGVVIALIEDIGMNGLHAGPLANAVAAEALTSLLIFMNRHYGSDRAGIRITGLGAEEIK